MNSSNPIKFGMFAMINDTLNVMFKSQCTQSKFLFDDTSLKLDACQLERHRNKTFETFFIGHVRYESRALHKKLSVNFNWDAYPYFFVCISNINILLYLKYKCSI